MYSLLPSIIPVTGLLNHSLNSQCDWNTFGIRKCISDQSSMRLFWRGVPVSNSRLKSLKNWLLIFLINLIVISQLLLNIWISLVWKSQTNASITAQNRFELNGSRSFRNGILSSLIFKIKIHLFGKSLIPKISKPKKKIYLQIEIFNRKFKICYKNLQYFNILFIIYCFIVLNIQINYAIN